MHRLTVIPRHHLSPRRRTKETRAVNIITGFSTAPGRRARCSDEYHSASSRCSDEYHSASSRLRTLGRRGAPAAPAASGRRFRDRPPPYSSLRTAPATSLFSTSFSSTASASETVGTGGGTSRDQTNGDTFESNGGGPPDRPPRRKKLTPRREAELEGELLRRCNDEVVDPALDVPLKSLWWLRRVTFEELGDEEKDEAEGGTMRKGRGVRVVLHLRVPNMLHPDLSELTRRIVEAAEGVVVEGRVAAAVVADDADGEEVEVDVEVSVRITAEPSRPLHLMPVPGGRRGGVLPSDAEEEARMRAEKLGPGLDRVTHFVAVYGCKGGVGKSTIAANLAYALAHRGARIGLLDVDVYGPSLPILIRPDDDAVRRSPLGKGMVLPIKHRGVKMLSLGFVSPQSGVPGSGRGGGAAVIRGPMAGRVVSQLLKGTDWGDLDVLIMDLPPGTGDVQLTVCQELPLSGAISVTTPSSLALADAIKGIEMFHSLGVPTLAAVENMAYFENTDGTRSYPFGSGIKQSLDEELSNALGSDVSDIIEMPISSATNSANEEGSPLCLSRPEEGKLELSLFDELAQKVSRKLFALQHGRQKRGSVSGGMDSVTFDGNPDVFDVASLSLTVLNEKEAFAVRLFSESRATEIIVSGEQLRSHNPKTGEPLDPKDGGKGGDLALRGSVCGSGDAMVQHHRSAKSSLFPAKIDKKGYYGYSVEWADGATIIYSMLSLARAAGGESNV